MENTVTFINEDTIKVWKIDLKKLEQHLQSVYPLNPEIQRYHLDSEAIFGENLSLCNECIYSIMEKRWHHDMPQYVYDVPVRIQKRSEGGWTISMSVDFWFPISVSDMKHIFCEQVTLKEFMGSRYNYNPRIKHNMNDLINIIRNTPK